MFLPFRATVCLAFSAIPVVAIRADADSFKPHKDLCWNPDEEPPDKLGTVTAIMTRNLGQQCRHEVQGLMEDLFKECEKIEGFSKQKCLKELLQWFTATEERNEGLRLRTKLADAPKEAMLWAGFHGGDPRGLNQTALEHFANMVDTSIVHPSTILGKIVQKNNDLLGCRGDPGASVPCFKRTSWDKGPVVNFWIGASRAFVEGMAARDQGSVVAVLNKGLDPTEKWSLYKSVFWNYELFTIGKELFDGFFPQILLIDMRGTCQKLVKLVTEELRKTFWRPTDTLLKAKPIMCFDCAKGQCDLDEALAARVRSCLGKDWRSWFRSWIRTPKCPRFELEYWRHTEVAVRGS
ncbi:Rabgap1l [Symbiodinium sp. CCMP2456]|nr:Rabgap1l [Symbiodinium sp. CCMP2456]